ncbi:hypothetical protein GCM10022224_103890 [Nonomuraea antimicrobica]|uniref:MerR HTH family regulatory protein n=1 Tax=Nonomuraea antimicrobica TaxID=561173 RepID=A0ABP7EN60_9ACTN
MDPEPISARDAAVRLRRRPSTFRKWRERYAARVIGREQRRIYYDWRDLATIDGCLARGEEVPATPEKRDELRASLRERWQGA